MFKKLFKRLFIIILFPAIFFVSYYGTSGLKYTYNFFKDIQNQEAQMEELYDNQGFILDKIDNVESDFINEIDRLNYKIFDLYGYLNSRIQKCEKIINIIKKENKESLLILESQNKKIVEQDREINSQNIKIVDLALNIAKSKRQSVINDALNIIEVTMKEVKPSYNYLESVTVYIFNRYNEDRGSIGTGIIIKQSSKYSYIITNKHVCDKFDIDTCNIMIRKYGQTVEIALEFVRQTESKYDLALWRTAEYLPYKKAINGLSQIKKQDKVYSVGNYLGNLYIYTEGTFAGYDNEGYFIFNLPCSRGCSGSGVFDKDGNLVSIIYSGNLISLFQEETAKIIGIPSEIVRLFLRNLI